MKDSLKMLVDIREELKLKIVDLQLELNQVAVRIEESCDHPEEYIEEKSSYYDGDYYNTAYTKTWRQCTICGEKSEITTKNHGWYG